MHIKPSKDKTILYKNLIFFNQFNFRCRSQSDIQKIKDYLKLNGQVKNCLFTFHLPHTEQKPVIIYLYGSPPDFNNSYICYQDHHSE